MDYRNSWSLTWMHPLLSALSTNPAFYYYYTAKADLLNQDDVDGEERWENCRNKYFRCFNLAKIKTYTLIFKMLKKKLDITFVNKSDPQGWNTIETTNTHNIVKPRLSFKSSYQNHASSMAG
ncbi:unnamed protein product [Allacma fusca]|uniref:Uncharacterized protein n=1 Tax=Allacma fusca TaxID=39272 RepID=A0A8J2JS04_9HEXA|nr:unnamed protein product [Allacma fusca]